MRSAFRVPGFTAATLRLLAVLSLMVTGMAGASTSLSAQAATANVSIETMQAQHGAFFDACYVLVGFSNEGCDDNRDGSVTFMDVPVGTYTVHQTRDLGSTAHVPDFEITVTGQSADGWETFETWVTHRAADPQANHVAIQTMENGLPAYDACYVLIGFSNEGCDDNQDGQVTFLDVPFGTYTVRQTADLGPNRSVADFTIEVSDSGLKSGWLTFTAAVTSQAVADEDKPIDIALITRDIDDGHLLAGACYVLVDFSNEGCDENNDGQVTFAQIPPGTYTVRQTTTPAGYPTIKDYEIEVSPLGRLPNGEAMQIPLGFVVKQAPEQNAEDTRNVSLVLIDSRTNERLVSGICVQFVDASNVACDEDLRDGQIDFLDVPAGTWQIKFSNLPAGWVIQEPNSRDGSFATIDASPEAPTQTMIVYGVYVPETASTTVTSNSDTWTASVQVMMCDTGPGGGTDMNCHAEAGIKVDISLASGEFMGSCTVGEPRPTPWNVSISTCSVEGMPFNEVFVASQDLSTVPAGYVPHNNQLTLSVNHLHPGGGDQATFTFVNVRTSTGPAQTTNATLLMTFRGCPEGFNPATDDYATNCTIPLDAPDAASLLDLRISGAMIAGLDRQPDGTYVYTGSSPAATFILEGLAPVVRDSYTVVGHDSADGAGRYQINYSSGGTRQVFIYYYYSLGTTQAPSQTTTSTSSATLLITMRGCPEGFNPNTDDFFANCTIPLDAPDASFLYHGGDGQGGMNIMWMDRQYDGAYIYQAGPSTMNVQLSGLAPTERDAYVVIGHDYESGGGYNINLVNGETRQVYVFYYYLP